MHMLALLKSLNLRILQKLIFFQVFFLYYENLSFKWSTQFEKLQFAFPV